MEMGWVLISRDQCTGEVGVFRSLLCLGVVCRGCKCRHRHGRVVPEERVVLCVEVVERCCKSPVKCGSRRAGAGLLIRKCRYSICGRRGLGHHPVDKHLAFGTKKFTFVGFKRQNNSLAKFSPRSTTSSNLAKK